MLSSAFDVGASGYPQMWGLDESDEKRILRAARVQILNSIVQRAERTQALFFAPFASWWRHAQPEHVVLASEMQHNTLDDLERVLAGKRTRLLRTAPGTSLNLKSMVVESSRLVDVEAPGALVPDVGVPLVPDAYLTADPGDEELAARLQFRLTELAASPFALAVEHVMFTVEVDDSTARAEAEFGRVVEK
jgi:hypothetical protein